MRKSITVGMGVAAALSLASCAAPGNQPAGAGLSSVGTQATPGNQPTRAGSADGATSAMGADTTAPSPTVPTISSSDLAAMANYGDTVQPVDITDRAARMEAHVSAKEAVAAATRGLGFLADGSVESVTLAHLTDAKYGIPGEVLPSAEGKATPTGSFTPLIENRLVWLTVFDYFPMFHSGPAPDDFTAIATPERSPSTVPDVDNRMWVAVDATSGDVLLARSIVLGR